MPKSIYGGTKRRTPSKSYRCSKCKAYFGSLKDLNLHYTARDDHKRNPAVSKRLKVKKLHEFSSEQQEQLAVLGEVLFDKRKLQAALKEALDKKLKERIARDPTIRYW